MPRDFGEIIANYATVTYPVEVASGSVTAKTGEGSLYGIMVTAAANTPLLAVYDNTVSSGTAILASFTPVAGTMYWFGAPLKFFTGLRVWSSGSVGCTIAYI